jgi:hypothetical protein
MSALLSFLEKVSQFAGLGLLLLGACADVVHELIELQTPQANPTPQAGRSDR